MYKFHPLQIVKKKIVKGRFLDFNLRAVRECNLHEILQNCTYQIDAVTAVEFQNVLRFPWSFVTKVTATGNTLDLISRQSGNDLACSFL